MWWVRLGFLASLLAALAIRGFNQPNPKKNGTSTAERGTRLTDFDVQWWGWKMRLKNTNRKRKRKVGLGAWELSFLHEQGWHGQIKARVGGSPMTKAPRK